MKLRSTEKVQRAEEQEKEAVVVDVTKWVYLFLFCLTTSTSYAQNERGSYKKRKIATTDVQLLLSNYSQTGRHSAITAGKGDESLNVYSNKLNIKHKIDSFNAYTINTQIDIVSSASTDEIDFNVSSASKKDIHGVLSIGYERNVPNTNWQWGTSARLSVESDYFSHGLAFWMAKESANKQNLFSFQGRYFLDDLRWGRKIHRPFSPKKLIYPEELRETEWFTQTKRHSYNLSLSWKRDINKKMSIAFFPYFSAQTGLLSTPFHRVKFDNGEIKVENLPSKKYKQALGIQYNAFVGDRTVIRTFYRYYSDNFNIKSNTFNLQTSVKINPVLWSIVFYRAYQQTASRYFRPFEQHSINSNYYVSDYDLSAFWSQKLGFGIRYHPFKGKLFFKKLSIRYAHYWRTDELKANIISSFFDL